MILHKFVVWSDGPSLSVQFPIGCRPLSWFAEITSESSPFSMHEHDPNLPATFGCRMWGLQLAAIDREPKGSHHGDGQNYQASFKDPLHAGTEFDLFEQRGGWLRIKLADDSDCWIPGTAADLI